jgi:RNA polymerase sigma factor (sigma-70 family)
MSDPSWSIDQMHAWLGRIRAGDQQARDELLRATCVRLERLASKMLRSFSHLRPMTDTGDVLNGALMRLMVSLTKIESPPASARAFFSLAACHIRRELLDLARHYGSAKRGGGRPLPLDAEHPGDFGVEPADPADDADALDRWSQFHATVEKLPAEEREVVGLKFYHGWTEAQIAELFRIDERTVRRRWRSACQTLSQVLGEEPPET